MQIISFFRIKIPGLFSACAVEIKSFWKLQQRSLIIFFLRTCIFYTKEKWLPRHSFASSCHGDRPTNPTCDSGFRSTTCEIATRQPRYASLSHKSGFFSAFFWKNSFAWRRCVIFSFPIIDEIDDPYFNKVINIQLSPKRKILCWVCGFWKIINLELVNSPFLYFISFWLLPLSSVGNWLFVSLPQILRTSHIHRLGPKRH